MAESRYILFMMLRKTEISEKFIHQFGVWFNGLPRHLKYHGAITFLILTSMMYLSTGTLAPYANTLNLQVPGYDYPRVDPDCHYLYNGDYHHFKALFWLLDGAPQKQWRFSVYQHRMLYNLIAYPVMKLFGHDAGGIATNFLLTWAAFVTFALFIFTTLGERGAIVSMWLLCVYPDMAYFVGQPFLHAIISPSCLWLYMILVGFDQRRRTADIAWLSFLMGILFLGYDLIVFFGFAAVMLLAIRKSYRQIPIALVMMLIPSLLWGGLWWALLSDYE